MQSEGRSPLSRKAFHKRYGEKHTMRNCIRRTRPKVVAAVISATENCQQELAQSGTAQFILDYAWDEETVEHAMSECMGLTLDDLLAPDDSGDDESDDDL